MPRGPSNRPIKEERFEFKAITSWMEEFREAARVAGEDMAEFARVSIERRVKGESDSFDPANALNMTRHKFLAKAPAGTWLEALESAGYFTLSEDIAEELEARDGDVIVRVMGESMEGAGIHDHSLLLMRPLTDNRQPRRGEVALVQIGDTNEEYWGTIKHWAPGNPPALTDGNGDAYPFPDNVKEVKAVAVARGIISQL